jgi:phage terminase large subunit-like protein
MVKPEDYLRMKENEKIKFYCPNGKQEEMINLVGAGKHFVYILSAGNGVGKSAAVINILGNIVYGPQNKWFEGKPLYEEWPYPKRARIVTESKNVEEIGAIDSEIKTWWPKGRYKSSKGGKQFISLYEADTGWVIDKMSYEQDLKEFESSTLGIVIFDEPPPRAIFEATKWRMRKGGIILVSMTPLEGAAWIFEEGGLLESDDCAIVYADIEDNCRTHGVRGVLEHAHIETMLKGASQEELEARKSGKPLSMVNTIWGSMWVPEVHEIDDNALPPPGSQYGMTIDPGDGKPYAIIWWWVDPRGHIVIDREWPEENWVKVLKNKSYQTMRMDEYLALFRKYEARINVTTRIMDRHYGTTRDVRTGRSLIDDWNILYGVEFQLSYNTEQEIDTGIRTVKDYIRFDKTKPVNAMNIPRLYLKKRCKNTKMSITKWPVRIDPETYIASPDRKSVYKDFSDCVRYTCQARPEIYVPRETPKRPELYVLGR